MADTTTKAPPVAAKKPSSVTHHGITVSDDYAWLRDPGYPEVTDKAVLEHLASENAWFEARMAPHRGTIDALFKEMRARIKEADKSVPQKDGEFLYWIEFEDGAEYKKWWRRPVAGGEDQLILDEPALAEGKDYFRLGAISTSKDGRLLACTVADISLGGARLEFDEELPAGTLLNLTDPDGQSVACERVWQDSTAIGVAFDFSEESLGLVSICVRNIVELDKQAGLRAG